jgi:hypothetical protein
MVSAAINGDLGIKTRNRRKYVEVSNRFNVYGEISLFYNDEFVVAKQFTSKAQRKKFIESWIAIYKLEDKKHIFFQVKYF